MTTETDGEVVLASRSAPDRFADLFRRHYPTIHAYLQRRVGPDDADDLAAETFVRAFRARGKYDVTRQDARPWLFGIASNLLREHWRQERRHLRRYATTGVDPLAPWTEEVDERLDAARDGPKLAEAIASLSRGERDVLLLHAWAELSPAQIAEALDLTPGTVRSRLSRAREHSRQRFSSTGQ